MINLRKHRFAYLVAGMAVVIVAVVPLFFSASCRSLQQTPAELKARESLRALTRGGVFPSEDAVARIESDFPRTTAGALARILRARIKTNARDFSGAAALLNASSIRDYTSIVDYALFLRASALDQAGSRGEARAGYEQLARDYPTSLRAREALVRAAQMMIEDAQPAGVPPLLNELAAMDDAAALLLTAKAYEQAGDTTRALAMYCRIYFFAPATRENAEAASAITRLSSSIAPATAEEANTRAEKLFQAKHYGEAFDAYADAMTRFPAGTTPELQLHRGIAAANAKRTADAITALTAMPPSAGELRAEALYNLALAYARSRQWPQARTAAEDLRRSFPTSVWTPRAFVQLGQAADDAKNTIDAAYFYRAAVNSYPGTAEVAQAQFNLAWAAHDAKDYAQSSRLLTEHLALYADKNTDNRGRAGYWAARDSERAGKLAEARALYQAVLGRYDANWYGYLAKQRLDTMTRNGNASQENYAAESRLGRAIANLQTVTVAEETAGAAEDQQIAKADQLSIIGTDDWAFEELAVASEAAPASPRVNLATARIYRAREDNVQALNVLKRSYPDYSQMKPEELTRDEWDVFYPLAYWDIIVQESRARSLDPFQVAGLIRQETIFNPRAKSSANAYGLMQVLVPTGKLTALKYGVDRTITADSLYEPRLNVQLGTAYLRDQIDKFGRIEYVAAAYNAGPIRVTQWRASLPLEIDEWAEAVPFKETRGYVQGVVRNRLQYLRLYDANGKFRPEVGASPVTPPPGAGATPTAQPANSTVRKRRTIGNEEE
ncbi:MAG TPA: transglycosylase SLT domain-containing protein [Pyrinomonadaceae bacterium]